MPYYCGYHLSQGVEAQYAVEDQYERIVVVEPSNPMDKHNCMGKQVNGEKCKRPALWETKAAERVKVRV